MTRAILSELHGPKLKLSRAKHHLDVLNCEIQGFVKSNPYTFTRQPNPKPPHYLVRAKINRVPPDELGLLIGDFAHNARCVLDLLVYQLSSLPSTEKGRGNLAFPIITDPAKYPESEQRKLPGVGNAERAFIKRHQSYHTRSDTHTPALELLHKINNADKHRLVQTVGAVARIDTVSLHGPGQIGSNVVLGTGAFVKLGHGASITGASFGDEAEFGFSLVNSGEMTKDGAVVAELTMGRRLNANINLDIAIEIQFRESDPRVQGRPVVPTLSFVFDGVEEVLREAEQLFFN